MIEVTSIPAAERKLKKPIDIPRPGKGKSARTGGAKQQEAETTRRDSAASRDAAFKQGIAVLSRTAKPRG